MSTYGSKSRKYEGDVEALGSFNELKDQFMRKSEYLTRVHGTQIDQSSNPILYFSEDPEMVRLISSKMEKLQNMERVQRMQKTGSFNNKNNTQREAETPFEEIQKKIQQQKRKLAALEKLEFEKSLSRQLIKNQLKSNTERNEKKRSPSTDPLPSVIDNTKKINKDVINTNNRNLLSKKKIVEQEQEYQYQNQQQLQKIKQSESRIKPNPLEPKKLSLIKNTNNDIVIKPLSNKTQSSIITNQEKSETGSKQKYKNIGISQNISIKFQPKKKVEQQKVQVSPLLKGHFKNITKIDIDDSEIEAHNSPTSNGRNPNQGKNTFSSTAGQFYLRNERDSRNSNRQEENQQGVSGGHKLSSSVGFKYPQQQSKRVIEIQNNDESNNDERNDQAQRLIESGSISTFGYRRAVDYEHRSMKNMLRIEQKSIQESRQIIESILDRDDEQATAPIGSSLNQLKVVKQAKAYLSTFNNPRKTVEFKKEIEKNEMKSSRYSLNSQNSRNSRDSPNIENLQNIQLLDKKRRPAKEDYIWNKNKLTYDNNNNVINANINSGNNNYNVGNYNYNNNANENIQYQSNQKYQKYIKKYEIEKPPSSSSRPPSNISNMSNTTSQFLKDSRVDKTKGVKELLGNYEFNFKIEPPVRLEGSINYPLINKQQEQRMTPIKPDYSSKELGNGIRPTLLKSSLEKNDKDKQKPQKYEKYDQDEQKQKESTVNRNLEIESIIKKKKVTQGTTATNTNKSRVSSSEKKQSKQKIQSKQRVQRLQKVQKVPRIQKTERIQRPQKKQRIQKIQRERLPSRQKPQKSQKIQKGQKKQKFQKVIIPSIKNNNSSLSSLPSIVKATKIVNFKDNSGNKFQNGGTTTIQKLRLKHFEKMPQPKIKLDDFEFPKLPGYPHSYLTQPEINQIFINTYALFKIIINDQNSMSVTQLKNYAYAIYDDIHIAWYPNLHFYIGGWKKNKAGGGNPHGFGIDYLPEKYLYEGGFIEGKREGFGNLKIFGGEFYQGQFEKGQKHGFGRCEELLETIYQGEWKDGKKQGYGKLINRQKEIYEGEFSNNMKHGNGEQTFLNGDLYKGEYENGRFSGTGLYTWENGSYYEGEFKAGWRNGKGLWRSSQLDVYDTYEGQYINDKKSGRGRYTWASGAYFQGEFLNDLRHGKGIIKLVSEKIVQGIWQKGLAKGAVRMLEDDFYRQSQKQRSITNGAKQIPIQGVGVDSIAGVVLKGRSNSSSSNWKLSPTKK